MEEKIEVLIKQNAKKEAQNEYLRKQLHEFMRQRRIVEIPEFEGKLDPDDFLEWMQTVDRIFKFKEISENKKVKLVAHKLRKYALSWWTNLLTKRVRQGKDKIRTWEKMRAKLKARFLPPNYVQINYSSKRKLATPLPKGQPLNKGSPSYPPKPAIPQKNKTPRRCFECQGLGHLASECPDRRIISLAECEVNFDLPPKFNEHEEQEEEMEGSTIEEPPKEGDVLLTFLEPTLKGEPSEFKDLKEMTLHCPALDTQTRTASHPLAKPILQESSHVFLNDIPHDIPPKITPQHHLDLIPKAIQPNKHQKEAMFQWGEYGVGAFHDSKLKPYFGDDKLENLRANSFLEGENDVSIGGLFDPNNNSPNKEESKAKNGLIKAPWTVFDPGKGQL